MSKSEAVGLAILFCFANLNTPLDPHMVWLERCWYTAYGDGLQPFSLLAA